MLRRFRNRNRAAVSGSLGKMLRFSSEVTEGETLLVQGELTLWEESYTAG
jgi:hypothetical protein